jgi:amylosucrase
MLNDYSYEHDPHRLADSRWVHRSPWQETLYQQRTDSSTHAGRVFQMMKTLSAVRRSHAVFSEQHLTVLETEHKALLAFNKQANGQVLTVIANFAEEPVALGADWLQRVLDGQSCRNLLDNKLILPDGELLLEPCQIVWLMLE